MPVRAWLSLVILLLNGCAIWPNQDHRALNMKSVEAIVSQHCSNSTQSSTPNAAALKQQQSTLKSIQTQLDMLTAATPGFTNAHCAQGKHTNKNELEGKVLVGANEWVHLSPPGHHYQARVDSGAATSSLSAKDIQYFERNGKRWVSFQLQHDDEVEAILVEAKVIRHVLIRQASSSEPERRPVVSLTVNIGQTLRYDTEFTLTDRSKMTYPILLGREFMRDVILIDVSRQFIHPKYKQQKISHLKPQISASNTVTSLGHMIKERP